MFFCFFFLRFFCPLKNPVVALFNRALRNSYLFSFSNIGEWVCIAPLAVLCYDNKLVRSISLKVLKGIKMKLDIDRGLSEVV